MDVRCAPVCAPVITAGRWLLCTGWDDSQTINFNELAAMFKDFELIPTPVNYASLLDVFVMTKAEPSYASGELLPCPAPSRARVRQDGLV